jgi:hypothetical protein
MSQRSIMINLEQKPLPAWTEGLKCQNRGMVGCIEVAEIAGMVLISHDLSVPPDDMLVKSGSYMVN